MLLYQADVLETIERADEFHIEADVATVESSEVVREVYKEGATPDSCPRDESV